MNIRSLTRGDGAVIGAAVLLLIASFLPFFSLDDCQKDCTVNSWDPSLFPGLPTIHLAAVVVAALLVLARTQPAERKWLGLGLEQWALPVAVFIGWSSLWAAFSDLWFQPGGADVDLNAHTAMGIGAWLTLVGGLAVAVLAVLNAIGVPALKASLLPPPRPAQPQQPYGAQPYGAYPGNGGYGYPTDHQQQPYGVQAHQQAAPQPTAPQAAAVPQEFAPFWFAVPVTRPLYPEDGSTSPVAELTPGTWYLAVDQRGPALVAQTQDGRRGVLQDTTGIQRG